MTRTAPRTATSLRTLLVALLAAIALSVAVYQVEPTPAHAHETYCFECDDIR